MKILIVGLVNNYQLVRLREEGKKKGHQVDGCFAADLIVSAQTDQFQPFLKDKKKKLEDYDLVYLMVSKRRWEWYTACLYLKEKKGTVIVNQKTVDPSHFYYLSPAIDYYQQFKEKLPFPKSAIIYTSKAVDSVIDQFNFPLILKTAGGRQGRGVYKIESKEELIQKIDRLKEESLFFILREFIPNDGDIRVFTVGYQAIGAMKRTPVKEGEFRSNISLGGQGAEFDLKGNPEIQKIAEKASQVTGTEIAGVDIMINQETKKPYILEINPGPQFEGLEKYTQTNAALRIIEYFEKLTGRKGDGKKISER